MKFRFKLILITLVFFNGLNGCYHRNQISENIFYLNFPLGIETLEPVHSNSPQTIWVLMNVMEGLVSYDKQNRIIPQLAKSNEISDDGLHYTFHLRTDVYFHNDICFPEKKGRKLIASDVKYSLERVNDPSTKTRGLWVFRDKIKGANEYYEFKSGKRKENIEHISGIEAIDDSTLAITLTKPFAPFLSLLTMTYAFIYPHEAVEYYKDNFYRHPVGTGPFIFEKWETDKSLTLTKNTLYYEKDSLNNSLPYLDGINISFTKSAESEFLDFLNDRYDYNEPTAEILDALTDDNGSLIEQSEKNFYLVKQPWLNTVYLIMLQNESLPGAKKSPFINNKKLRQAINFAIDKRKIVKYVLKNRGQAALNGPLPPGMPGYDTAIKGYNYDKEKAVNLLKDAGYPEGKGLNLSLYISNDELQKNISIAIQEQLRDIGININLEQVLQATLNTNQQNGEYEFTRGNWGADYFDPENFMSLFYSKNIIPFGPNKTGYTNPVIDKLYEKAIEITDFSERKNIYNEMQKIVIDDAAWIFLYYNQKNYLLRKSISGFYLDGLNNIVLKYTKKML